MGQVLPLQGSVDLQASYTGYTVKHFSQMVEQVSHPFTHALSHTIDVVGAG